MASFSESISFSYNSFFRDVTAQGDFLPRGFFATGTNRYNLLLTQSSFRISTGLNFVNASDVSITIRWGTNDVNSFTLDFADYGDRSNPYTLIPPSNSDDRTGLQAFYNFVRLGGRRATFEIENNPRITTLGISAQSGTGTGEVGVLESDRAFSWEWDIATAQAETSRWADIGLKNDTDDITIPDGFLRESGAGSFNRIRSRANQLRISLVGTSPRFSPAFENQGTIWIQNAATGENLAVIKNIASFWNNANNQYRINSDTPFISGSRSTLRTAISNVGVGEPIRFVLSKPPDGLEIYSASELGTASVGLSAPNLEISPRSEPGTGLVNVEKIPDLRIRARSGVPIVSGKVFQPTNLGITAKSLAGTAGTNLKSQVLKILARSGVGTGGVSAKKPTSLLVSPKSGQSSVLVKTSGLPLRILARSQAGTGGASVEDNKGLRISRRSRRGRVRLNLISPNLKASSISGTGTASTNLIPPVLKIQAFSAGGMSTVGLRKSTKLFLSAQSGTGSARFNLGSQKLKISARSLSGTGTAFIKEPGISFKGSSIAGTSKVNLTPPGIKISAQSSPGESRVRMAGARFSILARSLAGTGRINLSAPRLKISRRSRRGGGTVQVGLFSPTELLINAVSGQSSVRIKTSGLPLRVLAESGLGTGGMNLMIPDRPRDRVREALVEGQPQPGIYSTIALGGVYSKDANGGIYTVNAVK